MKRGASNKPIVWLPFSGGAMLGGLVLPILVVIFGLAVPLGMMKPPDYEMLRSLFTNPLTKIVIVVFVATCLLHAAHRLRYALVDLGLHGGRELVAVLLYGGAIAGAVWSGLVLFA